MIRILVADPLAEAGLARLRQLGEVDVRLKQTEDQLVEIINHYDALVVRSETRVTARVLEAASALKVVGRAGVGVDNIDLNAATRRGVIVVNAPRGNIIAAAEHTVALILALARNVAQADASVRRGEWTRSRFTGVEIRDKVLGVIGLGNIGSEVAKRAQGLEMSVVAYDPVVPAERAEMFNVELVSLEELLARSDFISLHVPLVEATRNLIDARRLALCKPTARLVNCARGGIVNEADLFAALRDGVIAGAAFDVFEHEPVGESPLLSLPNFVATPHVAASTAEAQASVGVDVANEVAAVLAGELPRYAVNAPSLPPEELAYLRPFAELAERMAQLVLQLGQARISDLELEFAGELAERETGYVTAAAIRGLVQPFTEDRVNSVNARLIAGNRGIALNERRLPGGAGQPSRVRLRVGAFEVTGTVVMGEPRITAIGAFRVDLKPEGRFLLSRHRDRPGVIGACGTILGARDINIASMQVGRDQPRGRALMILEVDDPVEEPVLESLREVPGMEDLRYVELGGPG